MNAGGRIPLAYLLEMFNQTAIVSCNSKCELEEFWICFARDNLTGYPTHPIPCPFGARNTSDSCLKSHCEFLSIPIRQRTIYRRVFDSYSNCYCCLMIFVLFVIIMKLFQCLSTRLDEEKKYFLYK